MLDEIGKWYAGVLGSKSRPAKRRKNPAKRLTVGQLITKLGSVTVAHDKARTKKTGLKPGRTRLLRSTLDRVRDDVRGLEDRSDNASLEKLRTSIQDRFHDFAPRLKVIKLINGQMFGNVVIRSRRPNPHRSHHTHDSSRGYAEYGIRHAAGEIAEDVVRHGYSEGWHGKQAEVASVEKLLKPFGIVYANELRGAWGTTRRNPSDADEFSRRRGLQYVEVRYFHGKRYDTTELTMRGTTIGTKSDSLKRGKVVSTTYFLPEFHGDPLGHLPIKRKNPTSKLTAKQKRGLLAFVRETKRGAARRPRKRP